MKKVLITGGFGYVGGRIAESLSGNPYFDLFITSRKTHIEEIPEWLSPRRILTLDLLNDEEVNRVCEGTDIIIHCAALNEIDSATNPERALLVNGLGTLKLLRAAEKAKVQRFIYFSTAHVYRTPLVGKITEDTLPRPVHPYAITHRTAEDFVLAASDSHTLEGIVVRLSNAIGAPVSPHVNRWTLVGNDLCRQALTARKITLKTPGQQKRDFIALRDVERAVTHIINLPFGSAGNGIFNLGGEQSISIFQLASMIQSRCENLFGFTPPIIRPDPAPDEHFEELAYSINKLKSTGFSLMGDINTEIDATLLFCEKHFRA
jgi:UDP-glucose 4-epimerase